MEFIISTNIFNKCKNKIILIVDNWDDYGYKTSFNAYYYDGDGKQTELGTIKIACTNMHSGKITEYMPKKFMKLGIEFYSLWQSPKSYKIISDLNNKLKINIYELLNDISYNKELIDVHREERVLVDSLFRFSSEFIVRTQYHRIAMGMAELTRYSFTYHIIGNEDVELNFDVNPDGYIPSNIHIIIGRNGTGKTTLMKDMVKSIVEKQEEKYGRFSYQDDDLPFKDYDLGRFERVICVSFSPFDDFSFVDTYKDMSIPCDYIGTSKKSNKGVLECIRDQFGESYIICINDVFKKRDLKDVISILNCDPVFNSYDILSIIDEANIDDIMNIFDSLSAGHKVVLAILSCCISKIAEKTILFIDEPENHLHPPLLAALIRALSVLLKKRNGVAIVSTHSPIVLQEVPRQCAWILNRNGEYVKAKRPTYETFGANVGSLMSEVFGYEMKNSGFITLIKEVVEKSDDYDTAIETFNYNIGDDGKIMARIMFGLKERGEL